MNSLAILTSFNLLQWYSINTQFITVVLNGLAASAVQRDGLCPGEHEIILQKAGMEGADYSLSAQGIKEVYMELT